MRHRWMAAVGGTLALLCLSTAAAKTSRNDAVKVLETFAAGAFQYQVAVAPCVRKKCPVVVNLLKNGKRVDQKALPQVAAMHDFERQPIDPSWTAWLFNIEPKIHVWNSGYENDYLGLLARPVRLDATNIGLLVTQLVGFDHLHRDHVLYIIDKNKLKKIWSFSESGYSMSSAISPVVIRNKHFLLFREEWSGFPQSNEEPDWQRSYLLNWQESKKKIDSISLPTKEIPLYAVVIDFYSKVSSAREATKRIKCADGINVWVLATDNYPQLKSSGKEMLGNIFVTSEELQKYQEGLKNCSPAINSKIISLN